MTDEQLGLKYFMESHFDFPVLKKIGFYAKGIRRTDYEKQADRVCRYFGLSSVFDYMTICHNVGIHISTIADKFKCPICSCEQNLPESVKPVYTIKCVGCKRKLKVSPSGYRNYLITEIAGSKESTTTYL